MRDATKTKKENRKHGERREGDGSSVPAHDLTPAGQLRTEDITSLTLEPADNLVGGERTSHLGEPRFNSGIGTRHQEGDA